MSVRSRLAVTFVVQLLAFAPALASAAQSSKLPEVSKFRLPGKSWVLQIKTDGFTLEQSQMADDGFGRMIMASNPATGVVMSVYLEKAPHKGSSRDARQYYWERSKGSPVKKDDIKLSDFGDLPIVERLVKEFQGKRVNQKNVNAYLAREDVWIDVHLSKVQFQDQDQELFVSILKSIKIGEGAAPDSMLYAGYGSAAYLKDDYRTAIRHYSKAVELNKQDRQMSKNIWRVVVDNLGMSYGLTGDLTNAKKIFEYGLTEDPDYPMFHYNLACTYGEMGNLDEAIAGLRKAFELSGNMNAGESMPNPATDSSFKRFVKTEKFRAFLREIGADRQ